MSQRECAGFNWPPLSIPAQEPISISPEAVKRAGCVNATICESGIPLSHGRGGNDPRLESVAVGVGHPLTVKLPIDPDVFNIFFCWANALAISEVVSALRAISVFVAFCCKTDLHGKPYQPTEWLFVTKAN